MKQNQSQHKRSYTLLPPASELPELMTTCPHCGGEVEMWSEEEETVCVFCSQKIFVRETTTH